MALMNHFISNSIDAQKIETCTESKTEAFVSMKKSQANHLMIIIHLCMCIGSISLRNLLA